MEKAGIAVADEQVAAETAAVAPPVWQMAALDRLLPTFESAAELFLQLAWAAVAGSLAEMNPLIEQHCAEGQAYGRPRPLFRTGERRGRGAR